LRCVRYEACERGKFSQGMVRSSQVARRLRLQVKAATCCLADVPAAAVDKTLHDLLLTLQQGDIIIDGATPTTLTTSGGPMNSSQRYSLCDAGTKWRSLGSERGYCLMIGGERISSSILDEFLP